MPSQLEAAMAVVSMETLIARAKAHALYGVCVIGQGQEYVATCLNGDGPCDPRNWNAAASVESALSGLEEAMNRTWGKA